MTYNTETAMVEGILIARVGGIRGSSADEMVRDATCAWQAIGAQVREFNASLVLVRWDVRGSLDTIQASRVGNALGQQPCSKHLRIAFVDCNPASQRIGAHGIRLAASLGWAISAFADEATAMNWLRQTEPAHRVVR